MNSNLNVSCLRISKLLVLKTLDELLSKRLMFKTLPNLSKCLVCKTLAKDKEITYSNLFFSANADEALLSLRFLDVFFVCTKKVLDFHL